MELEIKKDKEEVKLQLGDIVISKATDEVYIVLAIRDLIRDIIAVNIKDGYGSIGPFDSLDGLELRLKSMDYYIYSSNDYKLLITEK